MRWLSTWTVLLSGALGLAACNSGSRDELGTADHTGAERNVGENGALDAGYGRTGEGAAPSVLDAASGVPDAQPSPAPAPYPLSEPFPVEPGSAVLPPRLHANEPRGPFVSVDGGWVLTGTGDLALARVPRKGEVS